MHDQQLLSLTKSIGGMTSCFSLALILRVTPKRTARTTAHGSAHFMAPSTAAIRYHRALIPRLVTASATTVAFAYNVARRHADWTRFPAAVQRAGNWAEYRRFMAPIAIPIGTYIGRKLYLSPKMRSEHVTITAPSGKGKTTMYVLVILLSIAQSCDESVFVPDPKSELWQKSSGAMSRTHRIYSIAPIDLEQSDLYNPLAHIRGKQDAVQMVQTLVDATGGMGKEAFWANLASTLMVAAVMHLCVRPERPPLKALFDLFALHTADEVTAILEASPSRDARESAAALLRIIGKSERTIAGVIGEIVPRLDRINLPELMSIASGNTIQFDALVTEPSAVYMRIPAGLSMQYDFLSACFMAQMFQRLIEIADQPEHHGRIPRRMTCVLDEFCNFGKVPNLDQIISMMRSREIGMIAIVQGIEQVVQKYGINTAETLYTNATTQILLRGAGTADLKRYSERCGKTTDISVSVSYDANGIPHETERPVTRELIAPSELRTMADDQAFVLINDRPPIIVRQRAYYQRPGLMHLAKIEAPHVVKRRLEVAASLEIDEEVIDSTIEPIDHLKGLPE